MSTQLSALVERNQKKQEKMESGQSQIAALRKFSLMKEKSSLTTRLRSIDTLNKKLLRLEESGEGDDFNLQSESNCLGWPIRKYAKVWFAKKKREYLLCVGGVGRYSGQLVLANDQLQPIATFSHVPALSLDTLHSVIQF